MSTLPLSHYTLIGSWSPAALPCETVSIIHSFIHPANKHGGVSGCAIKTGKYSREHEGHCLLSTYVQGAYHFTMWLT